MEQLLIVEDDIGLNQGLCKALKVDDRKIISCQDLKTAKEQLLCGGVSLILLDINLPDGSGLELLREVKENTPGIPVILLTANDTDLDIVDGLERGADDYITKPFSVKELCARVRAVIRRKEYLSPVQDEVLTCGPISVNTAARRCLKNGEPVELTMKEFDLLVMLMRNAGRVLTRDALLDKVWGLEYFGDARTVDVHIRYLRQKIEDEPDNPRLVVTLRGVGYRFASAEDLK